jgi:hypothetical protein
MLMHMHIAVLDEAIYDKTLRLCTCVAAGSNNDKLASPFIDSKKSKLID